MPDIVAPAEIDETPVRGEKPSELARRLCQEKAQQAAKGHPAAFVLAADTVVACGARILPKAESEAEARFCLELLSGRRHRVLTGIMLREPNGRQHHRLVTTIVAFKRLEASDIACYIESGEWQGKAGGYAIQGLAAAFIRGINGSYSNVVGLPLFEVANLLRPHGLFPPPKASRERKP